MFIILFNSAYRGYCILLLLESSSKLLHLGHLNSLYLKIPVAIILKGTSSTVICRRFWKWKEEERWMKTVWLNAKWLCHKATCTVGLSWSCTAHLKSVISFISEHFALQSKITLHFHSCCCCCCCLMQLCIYALYKHTHVYKYIAMESQTTFIVGYATTVFHNTHTHLNVRNWNRDKPISYVTEC